MTNKKKILIIAVIILVSALALVVAGLKKNANETSLPSDNPSETPVVSTEEKEQTPEDKKQEKTEGEPKEKAPQNDIKAKFMYYVSEGDKNKEEALKVYEELKAEYKDKVDFIVINIDKEPEKVYGFALPDETPKLVLLGMSGEFAMKNNCADKEALKQELEKVLNP